MNWYAKVKAGHTKAFNFMELIGEMVVAGFVGLGSYMAGDALNLTASACAVMAGVGGHMGTRLLFLAEQWITKKIEGRHK